MTNTETIIAYRNPVEAFLWESGIMWLGVFAIVAVITSFCLGILTEYIVAKYNIKNRRKICDAVFVLSGFGIFIGLTANFYLR